MVETWFEPGTEHSLALAGDVRAIVGRLRRRLSEEANSGDFTPSQVSAIRRLALDGPMTLTTLARAEGMRPQSMGAIVTVLESEGIVSGEPHPTDGRQTILSVTSSAMATIRASSAAKDDWLSGVIDERLGMDEQAELARGIDLLRRLLEP